MRERFSPSHKKIFLFVFKKASQSGILQSQVVVRSQQRLSVHFTFTLGYRRQSSTITLPLRNSADFLKKISLKMKADLLFTITCTLVAVSLDAFQMPLGRNQKQQHNLKIVNSASTQRRSNSSTIPLLMSDGLSSSNDNTKTATAKDKYKPRKKSSSRNSSRTKVKKFTSSSNGIQTWRIFGVEVNPDLLPADLSKKPNVDNEGPGPGPGPGSIIEKKPVDQFYLSRPVLDSLLKRLRIKESSSSSHDLSLPSQINAVRVIRRSLDARKKKVLNEGPRYTYVIDVDMTEKAVMELRLKNQPGRNEILTPDMKEQAQTDENENESSEKKPIVIIVGAGPAGLFCALSLAQSHHCTPILLERGQPVESRGKDIGALIHRRTMSEESNFAFGEGGAGTWSDGKLTTRIGRNSRNVRKVLETFVEHGAPEKILVDGSPHLGTDNLVKLLRSMRLELRRLGGEVRFGAKMTKVVINGDKVAGVEVEYSESGERGVIPEGVRRGGTKETLYGDAVVLATGHSARDVYEELHKEGILLEPKGFAAGFRIEHPQRIINKIQYGDSWGRRAHSGKRLTDEWNTVFFPLSEDEVDHEGNLPVSSYRLATDKAFDGETNRGAYSFCMCPGGQIVPASTQAGEVCVNGMSFSRRDSVWANAALVVTIAPDDPVLEEYREKHGILAGIEFQREMERRAARMGGGGFTVPVQRLTDFINEVPSTTAPPSSYRLGVKPSPCHKIYPKAMVKSLQDAVVNHFEKQMPGFLCEDALLHGVETRTSSPVRICRDSETLQAIGKSGLYPSGEGAGFAGGIVSAAVDGLVVADAILESFLEDSNESDSTKSTRTKREKNVGFDY